MASAACLASASSVRVLCSFCVGKLYWYIVFEGFLSLTLTSGINTKSTMLEARAVFIAMKPVPAGGAMLAVTCCCV